MTALIAAAAAFVLLHLLVSGTRLRDVLVKAMGAGPYMGLFSLASVGLLVWVGFAYGAARSDPANTVYWTATTSIKYAQLVLMLLALLLIVPGLTTPNPTSVRQEGVLEKPDAVKGMLRITRHPFLWGVALWALGHLMANGDTASFILFGSMLALAVFGTVSIDTKRRRSLGETWKAFAAQTSNAPFGAILFGPQSLKFGEVGWWRIGLAVLIWAGLIAVHPLAFGVNPLP